MSLDQMFQNTNAGRIKMLRHAWASVIFNLKIYNTQNIKTFYSVIHNKALKKLHCRHKKSQ